MTGTYVQQRNATTSRSEDCKSAQQDQRSAGRYTEIRAVVLDYKTASAFSRATSASGASHSGGPAPMDVDNTDERERNAKDAAQETKA